MPTLVIHGDTDAIVPFEVSGKRTAEAIAGSTLVVVEGGPHGINVSHADEFNRALLEFLARREKAAESGESARNQWRSRRNNPQTRGVVIVTGGHRVPSVHA